MITGALSRLCALLHALTAAFLALILAMVFLQVVFRYLLQVSVPFTEEAARYFGVWMVFMGAAVAVARDRHIRVTFLIERAPGRLRTVLLLISDLLVLTFNGIIVIGGLRLTYLNWNQSAITFPVTVSVLYIAVALSAVCSILFTLRLVRRRSEERP